MIRQQVCYSDGKKKEQEWEVDTIYTSEGGASVQAKYGSLAQ